jgi:hypothetical protein
MLKKFVQQGRSRNLLTRPPQIASAILSRGIRWGPVRGENEAREEARLGAPGSGG